VVGQHGDVDMLVAPSAIATAMDTSATPRSTSGNFPFRASAAPGRRSARPVGQLAQQHCPGVPDQPWPSPVTVSL